MRVIDFDKLSVLAYNTIDDWDDIIDIINNPERRNKRTPRIFEGAQVKHGRWIVENTKYLKCSCSVCGKNVCGDVYKYCPNCGAKMDL